MSGHRSIEWLLAEAHRRDLSAEARHGRLAALARATDATAAPCTTNGSPTPRGQRPRASVAH